MRVGLSPSNKKRSTIKPNQMENAMKRQKKDINEIYLDEDMLNIKVNKILKIY